VDSNAYDVVRPPRRISPEESAPPPPSILFALGLATAAALIALSVELATSEGAPAGVQAGFVAAIVVALIGAASLAYGADRRRRFITLRLEDARDLEAQYLRPEPIGPLRPVVVDQELFLIERDLESTGAYRDAQWVAQLRRQLLTYPR